MLGVPGRREERQACSSSHTERRLRAFTRSVGRSTAHRRATPVEFGSGRPVRLRGTGTTFSFQRAKRGARGRFENDRHHAAYAGVQEIPSGNRVASINCGYGSITATDRPDRLVTIFACACLRHMGLEPPKAVDKPG